jgi:hypothetical protein
MNSQSHLILKRLSVAAMALGLFATATSSAHAAVLVFDETFNYANTAALQAAWTNVNGTGLALGTNSFIPTEPYATTGNGLNSRSLSQTVTESWTLSFDVLQNGTAARGTWVGLFNAAGTQGYGVLWDTTNNTTAYPHGLVTIRKFDLSSPISSWSENGTAISSTKDPGHSIQAVAPMADFVLSWNKLTGALSLSVDGTAIVSVNDTSFSSFSQIYVKGNALQYYDNMSVTAVPEPSAALLLLGAVVVGIGRRMIVRKTGRNG